MMRQVNATTIQSQRNMVLRPGTECSCALQGRDKATERIMKDLDNSFAKMRNEVDKDKVSASVRKEAMGPTRDAIKVGLLKRSFEVTLQMIGHMETMHRMHSQLSRVTFPRDKLRQWAIRTL